MDLAARVDERFDERGRQNDRQDGGASASSEPGDRRAGDGGGSRPLVVAEDGPVLEEIRRHAAAVGCEPVIVPDLDSAAGIWDDAPLVLVADEAASVAPGLTKRGEVYLLCRGKPPQSLWRRAFALGAADVVPLPDTDGVLLTVLADAAEAPSPDRGRVVAVIGGRGGAGASVLAAAVSVGAARAGSQALLVDCDPLGGGIDLVLGTEARSGLRWPDVRIRTGRVSMSALDEALPAESCGDGRLAVLSCDREGNAPTKEAAAAVVEAGVRAGRLVVCDLPRDIGSAGQRVLDAADVVVLVVPAELRAVVSAARVLERLGDARPRARVVVRGPSPDGLTPHEIAESVGAPLLAWLQTERRVAKDVERGALARRRRRGLTTAAQNVLRSAGSVRSAAAT